MCADLPIPCSCRLVHVGDVVAPLALTVRGTAKSIGQCERTTWQLIKDGRLHHVRVGTRVLVHVVEIERFLKREAQAGQQPGATAEVAL